MKPHVIIYGILSLLMLNSCNYLQKDPHDNCDIVVSNESEYNLWILIDGEPRGLVPNDGLKYTMWEGISTGVHRVEAYRDSGYTDFHCWSGTPYLYTGYDFYWRLLKNGRFTGTWQGSCQE